MKRRLVTYKDWRNGLGAQLSSLVGAWAAQLAKAPTLAVHSLDTSGLTGQLPPLLVPLGGLRYANKARCAKRDLACYFEPPTSCEAPAGTKAVRAAKTPPELAMKLGEELRLSRPRDKWWLRKELTAYFFRPNGATRAMLGRVRKEIRLQPPRTDSPPWTHPQTEVPQTPSLYDAASSSSPGTDPGNDNVSEGEGALSTSDLVAVHVRRGDKRDLGAKERGEPFSDRMYVAAALALADEVNAKGFLLASSEPETLIRLPPLLKPRPTFVMPAHYFVHVPEGMTPHMVIEKTRQEEGEHDEGMSQIVQLLLLAECRAFLGTVTSNFGQLVTKLMAMRTTTPVAFDLSCRGLQPIRPSASSTSGVASGALSVQSTHRSETWFEPEDWMPWVDQAAWPGQAARDDGVVADGRASVHGLSAEDQRRCRGHT